MAPLARPTRTISADAPPHPDGWQGAGAELRCCYRLIHNQRRKKSVLIIDLDCVTDSSGDVAPVECDVCTRREARVPGGESSVGGGSVCGGVGQGGGPAVTVRLADVVVSRNAVMVTGVLFPTANVVTVKLAEVCPPGTLTMPGTVATDELLVASVTEIPPAGAGELKNTVPVALVPPPGTVVGLIVIDCKSGGAFGSGLTLTKMDFVTPPAVANTFPPVGRPVTGLVAISKLLVLLP
jgi:hypothetical protein